MIGTITWPVILAAETAVDGVIAFTVPRGQPYILRIAAGPGLVAQQVSAQLRLQAAQGLWRSRYPGLALPQWPQDATLLPASEGGRGGDMPTVVVDDALLERHPQVRQARLEAEALEAQARFASAERQPDPTVGVQMGRERSGADSSPERVVAATMVKGLISSVCVRADGPCPIMMSSW